MNSKQVVAVISIVVLLVVLAYPALSTGSVSVVIGSKKIENADHVYVTIEDVWVHTAGQASFEGWHMLSNQTKTIDLVSLANSTTALGEGDISVASYDKVRIDVSNVTWVFNKTNTKLQLDSPQLPASLDFTVKAGKEVAITLVLTGHQEDLQGTKSFISTLNATMFET